MKRDCKYVPAAVCNRRAAATVRKSQQGVALVVTLILLSVITFMAVTFLVVSNHEGAQVDTVTQQSNAKFAADAGLEQAKAQMVATMLATTNGYNFGLFVSTNWISSGGFVSGVNSITNVAYTDINGYPLSASDQLIMLNNLLLLPRAPVFVTNRVKGTLDFRFYHDLNRNGAYDTNGLITEKNAQGQFVQNFYVGDPEWVGILDHPDQRHSSSNFFVARYCSIAVPIGNSLDINFNHNQAKDIVASGQVGYPEGFLRDQGVGAWEINLAGFLHELNTNAWDSSPSWWPNYLHGNSYAYYTDLRVPSVGDSFADAASLVSYRYNYSYPTLGKFIDGNPLFDRNGPLYPTNPFVSLPSGNLINPPSPPINNRINYYLYATNGLQTNYQPYSSDPDINNTMQGGLGSHDWLGNESTNRFYNPEELLTKVPYENNGSYVNPQNFTNRLATIGTYTNVGPGTLNSYNRYTFYRMLAQLGFDSAAEPSFSSNAPPYVANTAKLNLNYDNVTPYTNGTAVYAAATTNYKAWTAITWFTNAADRMVRSTFPIPVYATVGGVLRTNFLSITNIPLYPVNCYTPSLHRLLQLAANIYDAENANEFPTVFRPLFTWDGASNVWISGYTNVANAITDGNYNKKPILIPEEMNLLSAVPNNATANISGIPWVIGVKKGLPNFNKYIFKTDVYLTRKIQIVKPNAATFDSRTYITNVAYQMAITNSMLVQAWNSYNTNYPHPVSIFLKDFPSLGMTNAGRLLLFSNNPAGITPLSNNYITKWPGFDPNKAGDQDYLNAGSFQMVLMTNYATLDTNYPDYHFVNGSGVFNANRAFDTTAGNRLAVQPQFLIHITNRMQMAMFAVSPPGVYNLIDLVQFGGTNFGGSDYTMDVLSNAYAMTMTNPVWHGIWNTNWMGGGSVSTIGMSNQLAFSTNTAISTAEWINDTQTPVTANSVALARQSFNNFYYGPTTDTNAQQVPMTPTIRISMGAEYEANDPLVHYTLSDMSSNLYVINPATGSVVVSHSSSAITNVVGLGEPYFTNVFLPNARYSPWLNLGNSLHGDPVNANNIGVKDPMIRSPGDWQFPSNKFPNIGWLGRVHRGTPWQTVYLKSSTGTPGAAYSLATDVNTWAQWSADTNVNNWQAVPYTDPNTKITIKPYSSALDAVVSMPANDWRLLDLFTTSPNDVASKGQLSVNQTNIAAWGALLYGVNVLTETSNHFITPNNSPQATALDTFHGTNALKYIVDGINNSRTNFPGNVFTSVGQLLSAPQLTVQSPYLNPSTNVAVRDEILERLPQQIMSLVRVGSPRYVVYSYGQALKPAEHSIVTSGSYFGMCTNYQITGETGIRAVVRVDNAPVPGETGQFKPRVVVESYDILGTE